MQRQFNFQPSIYLAIALVAIHGAAMAALLSLALPFWAQVVLVFSLLSGLMHHLWRNAGLSAPSSNVSLMMDGDRIVLTSRNGEQVAGKLMPDSLITPLLTVLNVLPQDAHWVRSIIILPDSLDAESFRLLRVCLKWGR